MQPVESLIWLLLSEIEACQQSKPGAPIYAAQYTDHDSNLIKKYANHMHPSQMYVI